MIDVVLDSNGDREDQALAAIVDRVLKNMPVPRYVKIGVRDGAPIDKMNPIIHASVNGLVEVGRGCPRGCAFCSVGGRPLKWYPYDFIEKEILVNVREGQRTGILSATDVLLYGSKSVIPNKEAVIKLNVMAKKHWVRVGWSHSSLAAAVAGGDLLEKLSEVLIDGVKQRIIGVEVGVESGSPRIMEKHMPGKPKPFKCSEWPEVVEEAFAMMHDNNIVPASTLVVGLPGEEDIDVLKTTELVEKLKPYKSLIVPMFFVPMGPSKLGREEWFRRLRESHIDLLIACLKHDVYWAKRLIKEYLRGVSKKPLRIALEWFIGYAEKNIPRIREHLSRIIEERAREAQSYVME